MLKFRKTDFLKIVLSTLAFVPLELLISSSIHVQKNSEFILNEDTKIE